MNWFIREILLIKKSYNLIGPEAYLPGKTNQKKMMFLMLPSLDDYLQTKKSNILIGSFRWYCWLKNTAIW